VLSNRRAFLDHYQSTGLVVAGVDLEIRPS
jgi:hypothetical protein